MDDFSAENHSFWLKIQEMNGLGHGYAPFEFRENMMTHTELAGKKLQKNGPKISFSIFGTEGYDYLGV